MNLSRVPESNRYCKFCRLVPKPFGQPDLLWCGVELNHRHMDFQSIALPPELPHRIFKDRYFYNIEIISVNSRYYIKKFRRSFSIFIQIPNNLRIPLILSFFYLIFEPMLHRSPQIRRDKAANQKVDCLTMQYVPAYSSYIK